jgi:hypothetical protein
MTFKQVKVILGNYCRVSGIHGFQYLTENWSIIERIFWLGLLIVRYVEKGKKERKITIISTYLI